MQMDGQNPISEGQPIPPQQNVTQFNNLSKEPQPPATLSQSQNSLQPTVVQPIVTELANPSSNRSLTNELPKKGSKFQIIGGVLVVLGIFGVAGLVVNTILKVLLGHPQANTRGMAIVNIGTLSTTGLCLLIGIILVTLGTIRQLKYTKATKH